MKINRQLDLLIVFGSNKDETESWVNAINRNAALLSAAPLSAGIGSEVKFRRPLMPTAYSTLPLVSFMIIVSQGVMIVPEHHCML